MTTDRLPVARRRQQTYEVVGILADGAGVITRVTCVVCDISLSGDRFGFGRCVACGLHYCPHDLIGHIDAPDGCSSADIHRAAEAQRKRHDLFYAWMEILRNRRHWWRHLRMLPP